MVKLMNPDLPTYKILEVYKIKENKILIKKPTLKTLFQNSQIALISISLLF